MYNFVHILDLLIYLSSFFTYAELMQQKMWEGDVNELKATVKNQIEEIAKQWSREERDNCVNATAGAFKGGGAINGYLYGGSPH